MRRGCAKRLLFLVSARIHHELASLREAVVEALVEAIGKDRFDLWFPHPVSLQCHADGLRIAAADGFTLDCIRRQIRVELEGAYAKVVGRTPIMTFCVDADLAASQTPDDAPSAAPQARGQRPHSPPQGELRLRKIDEPRSESNGAPRRRFAKLDSFVVGEGNKLAVTAAQMVADNPGAANPLFVFGPTGSGKTHLLEGIWTTAVRRGVRPTVYLSAEQFTTHFLQALQGSGLPSFRRMHRDSRLLIIDDVQFFAGKKATLVELLHTIDTLLREGRQLVLAADRPPSQLGDLGPELVGRLSGGLVCGMQQADRDMRLGILRGMAASLEVAAPPAVLEEMADQLPGDGRRLAGALHRLKATSEALQSPITVDLARTALQELYATLRPAVSLADIERAVCDALGVDSRTLHSDRRTKAASQPRMLAMWLARKHTRAALSEIGEYFGRRSHSTVVAAQRQIESWRSDRLAVRGAAGDEPIGEVISRIERKLRAG